MATVRKVSSKRGKAAPAKRAVKKDAMSVQPDKPVASAKTAKKPKAPKPSKRVRDTFSMPEAEFEALRKLKTRAKSLGVPARKSEILRAGLRLLQRMDDEHFAVLLASVQSGP